LDNTEASDRLAGGGGLACPGGHKLLKELGTDHLVCHSFDIVHSSEFTSNITVKIGTIKGGCSDANNKPAWLKKNSVFC